MKREIIQTLDGSTTIHLPEWNESYHSKHGAIQEAYHVFIKNGLFLKKEKTIAILEIGFGTGLNAFITYLETQKHTNQKVNYTGIEAYPIALAEALQMNYAKLIDEKQNPIFELLHQTSWDDKHSISPNFNLTKRKQYFQDINDINAFDLIYFDAFGFGVQPELWSEAIFKLMYTALKDNGVLVTYACRTSIKNAMLSAGFSVEKLPGAPGKREMLRASKGV
ncbi:tRNA (5-methylaminomethyl-2-thiouridine)(34)-methyltransferase MnmD [Flavobacterium sp. IMCC34852]|uniref:tRNA (5-methylaminomethyl-2-thiouridine)(34)-methyltransferase MnmD n=1 Tax=Flavobacterium rivulicola TaxID=2732161 RepID=A0A7Y3R7M5_9FLAO|nr:tRNA (5-methylaminomethyl-2-thiouridine)(34)-methyltransferase MnmD [Flavobacterium sp. IMCC34852]NNT71429.1 tRNA (5-methylaminomethyl-2-thiouridine)(34)-methyltransferase MnmD [Flavobacterium sp. IMCC34852]